MLWVSNQASLAYAGPGSVFGAHPVKNSNYDLILGAWVFESKFELGVSSDAQGFEPAKSGLSRTWLGIWCSPGRKIRTMI